MGITDRFKTLLTNDVEIEDFEEEVVEETPHQSTQQVEQPAQVNQPQQSTLGSEFGLEEENKDANLILFEPNNFREAREIGEFIKSNTAVCLNLSSIEPEEGRRIMDFVSGVIFALDGKFTKAASGVFICAPKNIGVSGKISNNAGQAQENLKKW